MIFVLRLNIGCSFVEINFSFQFIHTTFIGKEDISIKIGVIFESKEADRDVDCNLFVDDNRRRGYHMLTS